MVGGWQGAERLDEPLSIENQLVALDHLEERQTVFEILLGEATNLE